MLYLKLFLLGMVGFIVHVGFRFNSLSKDAKVTNYELPFRRFIRLDWFSLFCSFMSVIIWLLLFGETSRNYPRISNWIECSFIGMGFTGSYILQSLLSVAKKRIRKVMDEKSNIADEK